MNVSVTIFLILFYLGLCKSSETGSTEREQRENKIEFGEEMGESCSCSGSLSRDVKQSVNPSVEHEPRCRTSQTCEKKEEASLQKLELNKKMVYIEGGHNYIGTDKPKIKSDGESPKRPVLLSPYFIDKYEVSNEGP